MALTPSPLKQGSNFWFTYRKYGEASNPANSCRVIERAEPFAVVGYSAGLPDLVVSLKSNAV